MTQYQRRRTYWLILPLQAYSQNVSAVSAVQTFLLAVLPLFRALAPALSPNFCRRAAEVPLLIAYTEDM